MTYKYMNNHFGRSRVSCMIPMNLQIFGNSDAGGNDGADGGSGKEDNDNNKNKDENLTHEQLIKALAEARDTNQRYKDSIDKLTKNNKNLSQAVKDRMTADEKEKAAAEEKDKKIAELEGKFRLLDYSKRYMGVGVDETAATELAGLTGELADPDKFFSTLDKFMKAALKKAGEDSVQALIKNNPNVNAGSGEGGSESLAVQKAKELAKGKSVVNEDILKKYM